MRNEEPEAVPHDFFVAGLGLATGVLAPGKAATIAFAARQAGSYSYGCTLHPRLMDGRVIVRRG